MTRREFSVAATLALAAGWPRRLQAADPPTRPAVPPDQLWAELLAGNRRFVAGRPKSHGVAQLRRELARRQQPRVSVLGCSDSRVGPELVFDQTLGELFVVRTAGNVADAVGLGSLEYAVEHLHTPLLVVLGHDKCGAVSAAVSGQTMPSPNLEAIVKRIAPAVARARGQGTGDQVLGLAVDANARQSALDLLEGSAILRRHADAGQLTIMRAVYRLATGEVVRLT